MSYTPKFVCSYCGKDMSVDMSNAVLTLCDCMEAREAWERGHREDMERRKKNRRKIKK